MRTRKELELVFNCNPCSAVVAAVKGMCSKTGSSYNSHKKVIEKREGRKTYRWSLLQV